MRAALAAQRCVSRTCRRGLTRNRRRIFRDFSRTEPSATRHPPSAMREKWHVLLAAIQSRCRAASLCLTAPHCASLRLTLPRQAAACARKKTASKAVLAALKALKAISTAFFGPFARILFAASRSTALKADFLTVRRRCAVAFWWDRLRGADVGFDSDFFGHGELRVKKLFLF